MAIKRNLILAGSLVTIAVSTLGVGAVSASQGSNKEDLVNKIASRFSLNKDEVQSVFDENRAEHQKERQAKREERLTSAVESGKLTEEQQSKILAKMDENHTFFESLEDMSPTERKTALEKHKKEMKTWANENGIDGDWAKPRHGGRHHGPEHGEHGPMGELDEQSDS
ncbi:MAG TPA: hypothetical protein PKB09_00720 [Candidatus Saccharibacteria bacterium]|nr:hypothetical protein [Candidatus Saccharibacteria bacterium]